MVNYNIANTLTQSARRHPHQEAVICPSGRDAYGRVAYTHLTYAQLDAASDRLARGMLAHGIGHGMRAAFLVKPSLEFFITTFALFKAKAVPVLIDPGIGVSRMRRCLKEAEAEAFIGIPAAHAARILLHWGGGGWKKKLSISRHRFPGTLSLSDLEKSAAAHSELALPMTSASELAAILFTSGSTGAPKGAIYTHGNFLAQIQLLKNSLGITIGERDLCTFPLFALFAPALGMSAIIPSMDFTRPARVNPERIAEAIRDFGISNMFGSPALIKRVAHYGAERKWTFPSLKRVISAGAPVSAKVIEKFRQLLPEDAQFYTPYGATESLPVAIAESKQLLGHAQSLTEKGHGICIGPIVTGTDVRIIAISDEAIENLDAATLLGEGSIGEIIVAGDQVTQSYYQRPEANALGKIFDPTSGRIFHRMGDLGYFDAQGLLWFCGRKAHRVQTREATLYTINCEAVFNRHPKVARTALVGIGPSEQETPILCVELLHKMKPTEVTQVFHELLQLGAEFEHTRGITKFLVHKNFPVDIRHNAKIF
ncbi:MAG: fatty acid CoA ligase family protein, partial [Proteobacteria bacterium]|nr:fatty acid CoA ligase family protein [Pseudomonadota bacterium]